MTHRLDARAQRIDLLAPRGYPKTFRFRFWSTIVLDANGLVDTGASTAQSLTGWTGWAFQILRPGRPALAITPDASQQASSKISVTIPTNLHPSIPAKGATHRFVGTNPSGVPISIFAGHFLLDDDPAANTASPTDVWNVDLHVGTDTIEIVQLAASSGGGGGGGGGAVDSVNGQTGVVILTAADIGFTPTGTIAANNVAAALAELATDYAAADSAEAAARSNADAAEVIARNNAISAAIAAVVNSAPGALDTLNELAVALGNDPNFATTITNLVAGKQPLDSDLTAIAALATSAFGRDFLTLADAAAGRTKLALGTAAIAATGDFDPAGAAAAVTAALAAHIALALDAHDASAISVLDTGNLLAAADVEAALAELAGASVSTAGVAKLLAGMTVPPNSGDRWKAGRGLEATFVAGPMDSSQLYACFIDPSIIADTSIRQALWIEAEEVYVTATTAGRALTDAVLNSTTTLTSATGAFVSTDKDRVIVGQGIPKNTYIASVTNSTTIVLSQAATATASGVAVQIGARHTIERGINGSTPAAHATLTAAARNKIKRVVHPGDSLTEGTSTDKIESGDGWDIRAARQLGDRAGGLIGKRWGMWRRTDLAQVHQEFVLTGIAGTAINSYADVGFQGAYVFTAGTANGWVWQRPANERVQAADLYWVDIGTTQCQWSYSIDDGATWIDNPAAASIYTSGPGIERRVRIICDDPTSIRVRAANAAGTPKTLYLPTAPLATWTTPIVPGVTTGIQWVNYGQAGVKLRTILNSRTFTDAAVTNGSPTVTSATAAFVSTDAGSTVYLEGVAYTILTRDSATQITLTTNYTATTGTGKRITIFQANNLGDRMADFYGHHGSMLPDLVILGPFVNDEGLPPIANGDANPAAMTDMLTYWVGKFKPFADVLVVAPYETNTAVVSSGLQQQYRDATEAVAAAQGTMFLNLHQAFAVYGYSGYAALLANGFILADGVHLTPKGNRWMGAHLARCLEIV